MLVGYARVSTADQTLALQRDALTGAGCERLFTDTASGATAERPGLDEALEFLRPGDALVVWRLDQLGRSLRHLIETVGTLEQRDIGFRSLQESIDTTTSGGKLVFHVFGALAEFDRELVRERTQAGLTAARARRAPEGARRPKGGDGAGALRRSRELHRGHLPHAARLAGDAVPVYPNNRRGGGRAQSRRVVSAAPGTETQRVALQMTPPG